MTELEWSTPETEEHINKLVFNWADFELKIIADRIAVVGTAELWF